MFVKGPFFKWLSDAWYEKLLNFFSAFQDPGSFPAQLGLKPEMVEKCTGQPREG